MDSIWAILRCNLPRKVGLLLQGDELRILKRNTLPVSIMSIRHIRWDGLLFALSLNLQMQSLHICMFDNKSLLMTFLMLKEALYLLKNSNDVDYLSCINSWMHCHGVFVEGVPLIEEGMSLIMKLLHMPCPTQVKCNEIVISFADYACKYVFRLLYDCSEHNNSEIVCGKRKYQWVERKGKNVHLLVDDHFYCWQYKTFLELMLAPTAYDIPLQTVFVRCFKQQIIREYYDSLNNTNCFTLLKLEKELMVLITNSIDEIRRHKDNKDCLLYWKCMSFLQCKIIQLFKQNSSSVIGIEHQIWLYRILQCIPAICDFVRDSLHKYYKSVEWLQTVNKLLSDSINAVIGTIKAWRCYYKLCLNWYSKNHRNTWREDIAADRYKFECSLLDAIYANARTLQLPPKLVGHCESSSYYEMLSFWTVTGYQLKIVQTFELQEWSFEKCDECLLYRNYFQSVHELVFTTLMSIFPVKSTGGCCRLQPNLDVTDASVVTKHISSFDADKLLIKDMFERAISDCNAHCIQLILPSANNSDQWMPIAKRVKIDE